MNAGPHTTFSSIERPALGDALVAERRQVEGRVAAVRDQLGEAAPDRRRLLQAVAGEAGRDEEIAVAGEGADDRVLVERVEVVVAGPGAARPDRLEGRARGRRAPARSSPRRTAWSTEEIGRRRVVLRRRRSPANIDLALRPDIDAARIDDERESGKRRPAGEAEDVALPRLDRKRDAERATSAGVAVPAVTDDRAWRRSAYPSARRTPPTRSPSRRISATSPSSIATPSERALRRSAWASE